MSTEKLSVEKLSVEKNPIEKWRDRLLAHEMVDVLNKRHFDAVYAEDAAEARQKLLDMIPEGSSVAVGGSVTITDMGLIDEFRTPKYRFFERFVGIDTVEKMIDIFKKSLTADFLVTGVNAVTENGELVNTDCSGNRVGNMIFGADRVIVITGVNKYVKNLDEAFSRIKKIAPMNAKRINHHSPCTETGKCEDCDCYDRICNVTTIMHSGHKFPGRITVIVAAEELGY